MLNKLDGTNSYYSELDTWRGIAIIWVLIHHVNIFFDLKKIPIDRFASIGFLGVDVFFVLSGYLISGLLLPDLSGNIRWKRFYIRRFFKIYPQYIIVFFFSVTISFICKDLTINTIHAFNTYAKVYSYLIFFQNYYVQIPTMAHTWSLAVEEHFYFFYPLLLILIIYLASFVKSKNPLLAKQYILGIIFLILIIIINILRNQSLSIPNTSEWWLKYPIIFQKTHMRVDALIFGCLLKLFDKKIINVLNSSLIIQAFVVLSSFGVWIFFYINSFDPFNWFSYTAFYLSSGLLIITSLSKNNIISVLFHYIPVIKTIGRWSYGIYLWHYVLIFYLVQFLGTNSIIVGIVCFMLSIVAGAVSTNTIEKYFLDIRNRFFP